MVFKNVFSLGTRFTELMSLNAVRMPRVYVSVDMGAAGVVGVVFCSFRSVFLVSFFPPLDLGCDKDLSWCRLGCSCR